MTVKAILTDINEAPAALQQFYVQRELAGKTVYALEAEGIDDHPAVVNLKNAYERVKADRQQLSSELKAAKDRLAGLPNDFDLNEWERMRTEDAVRKNDPTGKDLRAQIEAATDELRKTYEARIARISTNHEAALAERDNRLAAMDKEVRARLVGDGLRQALVKVGVRKGLIDAAIRSFEHDVEVVEEGGRRVARMLPELGGGDVFQYFQNWANSEEARDFIDPARGGDELGSRTTSTTGDNPFGKKTWSKTAQGAILKTDRAHAERLAKSAGFRTLEAALASSGPNE